MSRAPLVVAAALAIVAGSGTPVYQRRPPVSVEVDGIEMLTHRPLLHVGAGPGGYGSSDPCDSSVFALYEDGLIIYTTTKGSCPTLQAHIAPTRAKEIADTVAAGLNDVPHLQWATYCNHQGGIAIKVRRGTRWYRTRVRGVDRLGNVTCTVADDDEPHPNTLAALRMIASFDAPGAVPWISTEFAVELSRGASWPESLGSAVPWPSDLPLPNVDAEHAYSVTNYDVKYLDAANRPFSGHGPAFVKIGETTWRYGVWPDVLPERAYLAKVDFALSRAEADLPSR